MNAGPAAAYPPHTLGSRRAPISSFDVADFLDTVPVGHFHLRVLAICTVVSALAGFDAQAIGYVAPSLIAAWNLHPGELGPVFSVGLCGLMLGAILLAPLADRIGRRPVLLASLLVFGASSLLTAFAAGLTSLTILRFVTGLGLGGAMPNAVALTSEYMPARRRAFLVVMMFNGFNLGSMLGGILSAQFVDTLGWQAVFVVGGVLPLVLALVIRPQLPESVAFLALSRASHSQILQLLRRIQPNLKIDADLSALGGSHAPQPRLTVKMLFTAGRAWLTILLWLVTFMSLLDIYLLVSWLPTALNSAGAAVGAAITAGIMLQLGSIVGCFPIGWALDRYGFGTALPPAYLLGAVCIAGLGAFTSNIAVTLAIAFGAGFGLIGGQAAANALAAMLYPTEMRSQGAGWALGMGSVGSIAGPVIGAALLEGHIGIRNVFLLSAVPALLTALALMALGSLIARRDARS